MKQKQILNACKKIQCAIHQDKNRFRVIKNGNTLQFTADGDGNVMYLVCVSPNTDVTRDYSEDVFYTKIKDAIKALEEK